ncbi:hypothetical protein GWK47_051608 [Chionoecetes opilio]|uniref:Uncharacterized protein n=1 Tax=Chionoecetes opilio TaxID=41210 RepID=A0A8J4Y7A0_CHIOP|nr:hypothetical protein GWK47_051608 [Chionoecetes opilio]
MKAWLGAAAAVSGVGTLVYLMARSGRRRDTGHSGTALGTHTTKGCTTEDSCVSRDSQDTGYEKDGPYDQMNGHVPIEGNTNESLMPADTDPEEYHSEGTEQKLCGNLLTSNETSDVKSSVEGLSSNSENVSDYVSVIENEAVVKECTNSVSHACIEVRPHMDSGGTAQQARVKGAVTESASDNLHLQANHEQNDSVMIQEKSVRD